MLSDEQNHVCKSQWLHRTGDTWKSEIKIQWDKISQAHKNRWVTVCDLSFFCCCFVLSNFPHSSALKWKLSMSSWCANWSRGLQSRRLHTSSLASTSQLWPADPTTTRTAHSFTSILNIFLESPCSFWYSNLHQLHQCLLSPNLSLSKRGDLLMLLTLGWSPDSHWGKNCRRVILHLLQISPSWTLCFFDDNGIKEKKKAH